GVRGSTVIRWMSIPNLGRSAKVLWGVTGIIAKRLGEGLYSKAELVFECCAREAFRAAIGLTTRRRLKVFLKSISRKLPTNSNRRTHQKLILFPSSAPGWNFSKK